MLSNKSGPHSRGVRWAKLTCMSMAVAAVFNAPPRTAVAQPDPQSTTPANNEQLSQERALRRSEQVRAVTKAKEIEAKALAIDRVKGSYTDEFLQEIDAFYRYGVGTPEHPGDALVTQKLCREAVIALLWDLFLTRITATNAPTSPERFRHALDEESAQRFRIFLSEILLTAFDDLLSEQRIRVYRLAGLVLSEEDSVAVTALTAISSRDELTDGERALVEITIDQIRRTQPEFNTDVATPSSSQS